MQGNAAQVPAKLRFMSGGALKGAHKPLNWPFFFELALQLCFDP
jgi:hypothetical protein